MNQVTIAKQVTFNGIGLHSGKKVNLKLTPAPENTGILIKRTDLKENNEIQATYSNVTDTKLCTLLSNSHGVSIGTVEHLFAALAYLLVDNLIIEVNAPEIPILDGSSKEFIEKIETVGLKFQNASKKVLKVLNTVELETENYKVKLSPSEKYELAITIDFPEEAIGRQTYSLSSLFNFKEELSNARTFTSLGVIEHLRSIGLAQGGSLDNAIVVDKEKVLNPEGLRHKDEFARHKLLDAVGDLYLAGYIIQGKFEGYKSGHDANNKILRALFANPENYIVYETIAPKASFLQSKATHLSS